MTTESKWTLNLINSQITFQVKPLMMVNLDGVFSGFDAGIYMLANNFMTAEVNLRIDSATVSTSDEKRDEHLRSIDFLDAGNHPQITFVSTSVEKSSLDGSYVLFGDLTLKGVTKKIKLSAKHGPTVYDSFGNKTIEFIFSGGISQSGWGLNCDRLIEDGSKIKAEEILITCQLELSNARQRNLQMDLAHKAATGFNESGTL